MKLIGMLDSPYVRRTAISLRHLGIPFEHQALSVFSTFDEFQKINPVVKAPTLVFENGEVLMDSTLILEYAEFISKSSLMPAGVNERKQALRIIGLALASCEKAVQIVYERNLRPIEKQYEPWLVRIRSQLLAACAALETEISRREIFFTHQKITQAEITSAVAWQFIQSMLSEIVIASEFPALQNLSNKAEKLPEFIAFPPVGPGVVASN
ncbi:MAG: glutathione S-transferase [Methylotenera sp.]